MTNDAPVAITQSSSFDWMSWARSELGSTWFQDGEGHLCAIVDPHTQRLLDLIKGTHLAEHIRIVENGPTAKHIALNKNFVSELLGRDGALQHLRANHATIGDHIAADAAVIKQMQQPEEEASLLTNATGFQWEVKDGHYIAGLTGQELWDNVGYFIRWHEDREPTISHDPQFLNSGTLFGRAQIVPAIKQIGQDNYKISLSSDQVNQLLAQHEQDQPAAPAKPAPTIGDEIVAGDDLPKPDPRSFGVPIPPGHFMLTKGESPQRPTGLKTHKPPLSPLSPQARERCCG